MRDWLLSWLGVFARPYRLLVVLLALPVVLAEFFHPGTGAEYDIDFPTKLVLAARMMRNNRRIPTGSTFLEHLVIATKLLSLPPEVEGSVVECGCYKGGSTANLSLIAARCDRRLEVFDSFEGMPVPSEADRTHTLVASEELHTYAEGAWRASVEEVRTNVGRYGDLEACTFHAGYFEETMDAFDGPCVLVFLDVGLRDSAETCLRRLWPALVDGGFCFTHDVKHMEIASLFFDALWWTDTFQRDPPGLVGAGNGLGLHPGSNGFSSMLGYTVKNPATTGFEAVSQTGAGSNCVDARVFSRDP